MTVYELIQDLARYSSEADISIRFTASKKDVVCDECNEVFELDRQDFLTSNITVDNNHEQYSVYLICEES